MENEPATELENAAESASVAAGEPVMVDDELLVEEISIDGMCGVY
jgi:mycofactocin precursor